LTQLLDEGERGELKARLGRAEKMKTMRTISKTGRAIAAFGALAALAAGGAAVSGCGASATLDPVARAAEVTSQQTGARISLAMRFSSPALPSPFAITASGYVDARDRTGEMTMDLSQIPGGSALLGGGGALRMIFQYPTIYMDMPFLAGRLPEGKTWMKLDVTKAAQAAGIDASQLSSIDEADPSQFLSYLRASSGGVVTVGSEAVDGVSATHYRAAIQLSRILERLPGDQQAAAHAALEKLGAAGSIPVDVWVDAQGRVRREQLAIGAAGTTLGGTVGTAGAAAGVSGTITVDYQSYGAIPPIVAPPANQVFDASAMIAAGLKG
jgi:hypothetical protein